MRIVTLAFAGIALLALCVPASALSINLYAGGDDAGFAGQLLAPASGITIVGGTESFVGLVGAGSVAQSGTYSGLSLVPSLGGYPVITNPDGIFLTTGTANIALSNTSDAFSNVRGGASDGDLDLLLGGNSFDANILEFDFTVAAGVTSIEADFVFGTEEWSEYPDFPDIFAFIVDGVNYAKFPNGDLIQFSTGSVASNFNDNEIADGSPYALEYDGITNSLHIVGILDDTLTTHHFKIVIGDAFDSQLDSGVFIGNLVAGEGSGGGIDNGQVPEPTSIALLGLGLAGLGLVARKRRRA
jgi:hypothetical protein